MVFSRMTLQHSSCEPGLSLIYISTNCRKNEDDLTGFNRISVRPSWLLQSQSNFLLGSQLYGYSWDCVSVHPGLGVKLSIRHRLRIQDTTRKPFFEITFLVLARIPFKMWKILTFFSMSPWSSLTPLRSSIFQVWDVTMSHMWIWVRDQAVIVTCQRSRLFFVFNFFIYLLIILLVSIV